MDRFGLADVAALLIGLAIFVALGYLTTYRAEIARFIMSRADSAPGAAAGMEPVYIPVSQTSMDDHTGAPAGAGMGSAAPDIDAPDAGMDDWELPRLSARLSDAEMIVLLATQRRADGKHRYSANAIHTLVGGDRNMVLARVKELRETAPPAVYRPLTPDHQAELPPRR